MPQAPFPLDRALLKRRFDRAAATFDQASHLDREVARRMGERLEYIRLAPKTVLDLGCGTGADLNFLGERYPGARRIACDLAPAMLMKARERTGWFKRLMGASGQARLLCGDAEKLPLASGSVDLLWSNLMLHWLADPLPALKEMQRVLAVDGLLMFTTLGPDTLKELREASGAMGSRVHGFIDMHDIGDMLVAAGFAEPVMDMEMLTLTYGSVSAMFADLKARGATHAGLERSRGLSGRKAWQQRMAALEARMRDGRLPVSIEVVYGHAWKGRPKTTPDGRAIIDFDPSRRSRR